MNRKPGPALLLGAAVLALALLVLGRAVAGALTVERTEAAPPARAIPEAKAAPAEPVQVEKQVRAPRELPPRLEPEEVQLVVDADPFHPERRAPDQPYMLPGEEPEAEPEAPPPPPPPPQMRVLGTAVTAEGGVALLQVQDGSPIVVSVGETLPGGFTLRRVSQMQALVQDDDGRTHTFAVQAAPRQQGRGNARNTRTNQNNSRAVQQRTQEMREYLEECTRAGNCSRERLEVLRNMVETLRNSGGNNGNSNNREGETVIRLEPGVIRGIDQLRTRRPPPDTSDARNRAPDHR